MSLVREVIGWRHTNGCPGCPISGVRDDGHHGAVSEQIDRQKQGARPRIQASRQTDPGRPEVEGVLLIEGPEPGDALVGHEVEHQVREYPAARATA